MGNFLLDATLFADTLRSLRIFITFIIPCVLILLPIRFFTKIPSYIFRKLLHIIAFSCVMIMIITAGNWQAAAMASIAIAIAIYPVLRLFESKPWYANLFADQRILCVVLGAWNDFAYGFYCRICRRTVRRGCRAFQRKRMGHSDSTCRDCSRSAACWMI